MLSGIIGTSSLDGLNLEATAPDNANAGILFRLGSPGMARMVEPGVGIG
jgi:hypothetical protein